MRRLLAFAAVFSLIVPVAASAQARVGVGMGLRAASVSIDDPDDPVPDSRTGFSINGFVSIPLTDNFSLQPGLGFGQRGGSESEDNQTVTLELDYLEVPILGVFTLPSESEVGLHLFAGPTLAFELGCTLASEGFSSGEGPAEDCEDEDIFTKSTDFGLTGGAALSYGVNESTSLFLAAFYNLGLTDINDEVGDTESSVKNRVLGINVGASFALGGS